MKKKGFTLIELLVVISIIAMLLAILMPALGKVKEMAQRVVCGTNCKGIGTSMIIYASDYDDSFPVSGDGSTGDPEKWGAPNFDWEDPGYDFSGEDSMTISSCLYLLIKEVDGDPASFVCKSGSESVFDGDNTNNLDLTQLHDFSGNSTRYVSYAYHHPFASPNNDTGYPASGNSGSSFAVLADKNPALDSTIEINGSLGTNYSDGFEGVVCQLANDWDPTATLKKWQKAIANSGNHKRDGQNVLFGDGHVTFEKRPDIAVRNDHIYSPASGSNSNETQRRQGRNVSIINIGAVRATHRSDSYLVNDDDG